MANCPNCKASLTCSCQKRAASNGTIVCTNCINNYEAGITQLKNTKKDDQILTPTQRLNLTS